MRVPTAETVGFAATGRRKQLEIVRHVRKPEHAALPKVQEVERARSASPSRVIFSQSVVRETASRPAAFAI